MITIAKSQPPQVISSWQGCSLRRQVIAAALGITVLLAIPWKTQALEPHEMLSDPVLEDRARFIGQRLRCPVCQGQSVEDSQAPLAAGLRQFIRRHVVSGASDEVVFELVRQRYGDEALLNPPLQSNTYLLWSLPFILLAIGSFAVGIHLRSSAAWGFKEETPRTLDQPLGSE